MLNDEKPAGALSLLATDSDSSEEVTEEEKPQIDLITDDSESDEEKEKSIFEDSDESEDDSSDEEEESDDKTRTVPYARFKKKNDQWKTEKSRADEAEEELEKIKDSLDSTQKTFQDLYGRFEDPIGTLKFDKTFVDLIQQHRSVPEINTAVNLIMNYLQNGGEMKMSKTNETSTSTIDPRISKILSRELKQRTNVILDAAKVRSELRSVLTTHVLDVTEALEEEVSDEDIKIILQDYVKEQGWDSKFLQSTNTKSTQVAPPTGKARSATVTRKVKETDSEEKETEPKTADEWSRRQSSRLFDLIEEANQ